MFSNINNATLSLRLKGIEDAQNRSRLSFFLLTYATGAILFGLWNMYLSWERQWGFVEIQPKNWGQSEVIAQQIKSWVEGQSIGISILGLRVSVSDINVLGSFVLFILSFYCCMCARRENHEIGGLLLDTRNDQMDVKSHIASSIKSGMVLNPTTTNDAPYKSLNEVRPIKKIAISRATQVSLIFLPPIAIFIGLLSDLYFSFFYSSPWRDNSGPAWESLDLTYKQQLILTDLFGLIMGIFTFIFCRYSANYFRATKFIFNEYCPAGNSE